MIEYTEISFDMCVAKTELAACLVIDDEYIWVPRSVFDRLEDEPEMGDGPGECSIAVWFVSDKGLV